MADAEASTKLINQCRGLQRRLLAWFEPERRKLPWRKERSPYRVWLSEIMGQQTRLEAVVPYFQRFVERFPDVDSLSAASEEEVLALWSGLGYYARARNLHRAARQIADRHQGLLPTTTAALRELAGIGRYSAGAIASIAFGQPEAVLDGNVIRVLSRLVDLDADVSLARIREALWALAAQLVPANRPGDFNEALMDLGALVCAPVGPDCGVCPLSAMCLAKQRGTQEQRPVKRQKTPPRAVTVMAASVIRDRQLLLLRRPAQGLFGGLWMLPMVPEQADRTPKNGSRALQTYLSQIGIAVDVADRLAVVKHMLTHRNLTVELYTTTLRPGGAVRDITSEHRWITQDHDLGSLGLPNLTRKLLEQLGWQKKGAL